MGKTLDEAECLRILGEATCYEAYDLLFDEAPDIERKFRRVDKAICNLLAEVRKTFPDATYYTASGGFHLLLGASHDNHANSQRELVALSGEASIGDGDF